MTSSVELPVSRHMPGLSLVPLHLLHLPLDGPLPHVAGPGEGSPGAVELSAGGNVSSGSIELSVRPDPGPPVCLTV